MATSPLPSDFSEFLRLLNEHDVEYLLIGGYAVGYYGYVRATADMDIWIGLSEENAERMVDVLQEFGFGVRELETGLFMREDRIVRMGVPPMRIEIMTSISGVNFGDCFADRVVAEWDDLRVNVISLEKLKENKRASARLQDLSDLEHLP